MTELIQLESSKKELKWNRYAFSKLIPFSSTQIKLSGIFLKTPKTREEVVAVDAASNGPKPSGEDRDGPDLPGEDLKG